MEHVSLELRLRWSISAAAKVDGTADKNLLWNNGRCYQVLVWRPKQESNLLTLSIKINTVIMNTIWKSMLFPWLPSHGAPVNTVKSLFTPNWQGYNQSVTAWFTRQNNVWEKLGNWISIWYVLYVITKGRDRTITTPVHNDPWYKDVNNGKCCIWRFHLFVASIFLGQVVTLF